MGAISDRIGRKLPLVARHARACAARRCCSPSPTRWPWLFAARLVQGAADARDLGRRLRAHRRPLPAGRTRPRHGYRDVGHELRLHGRADARRLAVRGRRHAPAVSVRGGARARSAPPGSPAADAAAERSTRRGPSIWSVIRVPPVAFCAAVVVLAGATVAMLEPVLPLFFDRRARPHPGADRPAVRRRRRGVDPDAARLRSDDRPLGRAAG